MRTRFLTLLAGLTAAAPAAVSAQTCQGLWPAAESGSHAYRLGAFAASAYDTYATPIDSAHTRGTGPAAAGIEFGASSAGLVLTGTLAGVRHTTIGPGHMMARADLLVPLGTLTPSTRTHAGACLTGGAGLASSPTLVSVNGADTTRRATTGGAAQVGVLAGGTHIWLVPRPGSYGFGWTSGIVLSQRFLSAKRGGETVRLLTQRYGRARLGMSYLPTPRTSVAVTGDFPLSGQDPLPAGVRIGGVLGFGHWTKDPIDW